MPKYTSTIRALNLAHIQGTRNELATTVRQTSIEALCRATAESLDSALAARQARWNVRGPGFGTLRGVFSNISDELIAIADELAERASALGGLPSATPQSIAAQGQQRPYSVLSIDSDEHVEGLSRRLAHLGSELRQTVNELAQSGDAVTVGILTRCCARVDRLLWSIESHEEATVA